MSKRALKEARNPRHFHRYKVFWKHSNMLIKDIVQKYSEEKLISLPLEAVARFGRGSVSATAISPDGNIFAVASRIGVWLYNVHTDDFIRLIAVEGTGLLSVVTFSPDGTRIATGDWDGIATVWDVANGTELAIFTKTDYISSVAFSPDGMFLGTGSRDGKAALWDIDTGAARWTVSHTDCVPSVTFSPDGKFLATASWDSTANIWNVETGEKRWRFSHPKKKVNITFESGNVETFENGGINRIAFSQNGQLFVTGGRFEGSNGGCTTLWDVESGEAIWDFTHEESVTSFAFSSDNRYMETRFWSGETDVRCIADGTSTSFHKGTLAKSTREVPLNHPRDLYGWLVNFSPDGKHLVSMASSSSIKTWSAKSGENIKTIDRDVDAGQAKSLTFTTEGNYIGLSRSGDTATLWVDEEQMAVFSCEGNITAAAISLDSTLVATGCVDGMIYLWNVETQVLLHTFIGHTGLINALAFSPDKTCLVSAGGHKMEIKEQDGEVYIFCDGNNPGDQTAKVWDIRTGTEIASLQHPTGVQEVVFSPDGKCLATSSEINVNLWDIKTWKKNVTLEDVRAESFVFSPNNSLLAVGGRGRNAKIEIWDVETTKLIVEFSGHKSAVESVAFSPDGTLLASGGFDGVIYLWDLKPYLKNTYCFF